MGNNSPNTSGIIQFQKKQSKEKKESVISTINELIAIRAPISKAEICKRSGVSRTFLYANPDLLDLINNAAQSAPRPPRTAKKTTTDKSKHLINESLKRRNALLEKENKELRREKELLLGKLATRK